MLRLGILFIALFYILTLANATKSPCKFPKQWYGFIGQAKYWKVARRGKYSASALWVAIDTVNGKARIEDLTRDKTYLFDANTKRVYSRNKKSCCTFITKKVLKAPAFPASTWWLKTFNFGAGRYPFDVYAWYYSKNRSFRTGGVSAVGSQSCIPTMEAGYQKFGRKTLYYGKSYVNLTIGAPLATAFKRPAACAFAQEPTRSIDVSVDDLINRSLGVFRVEDSTTPAEIELMIDGYIKQSKERNTVSKEYHKKIDNLLSDNIVDRLFF